VFQKHEYEESCFGRNRLFNIQVCGYARNFSNGDLFPLTTPIHDRSDFRDTNVRKRPEYLSRYSYSGVAKRLGVRTLVH
jgi:hypothetical protein